MVCDALELPYRDACFVSFGSAFRHPILLFGGYFSSCIHILSTGLRHLHRRDSPLLDAREAASRNQGTMPLLTLPRQAYIIFIYAYYPKFPKPRNSSASSALEHPYSSSSGQWSKLGRASDGLKKGVRTCLCRGYCPHTRPNRRAMGTGGERGRKKRR